MEPNPGEHPRRYSFAMGMRSNARFATLLTVLVAVLSMTAVLTVLPAFAQHPARSHAVHGGPDALRAGDDVGRPALVSAPVVARQTIARAGVLRPSVRRPDLPLTDLGARALGLAAFALGLVLADRPRCRSVACAVGLPVRAPPARG